MSNKSHDNDNEFSFDAGWIFPIIMTAVFWPVGLYLLFKKYRETRARANRTKNYAPITSGGGILTLIGLFLVLDASSPIGLFMFIGGLVMLITSLSGRRKNSRLERTYLNIIGSQSFISIRDLARTTGRSQAKVMKDLEKMLENNLLPETAYIDHAAKMLVLNADALRAHNAAQANEPDEPIIAEVVEPTPKKEAAKKVSSPEDIEAEHLRETFDAKLREIRYWNEEIDDVRVSDRIDEIEATTANIFYLVREKPERASEIRTFMNYYLPTTLKLLKTYARLEKQGVAGENVQNSRQEIERILDKLSEGFRQQLDRLFQADAIDISSDIDVLETMMAKDGLTDRMKVH